MLLHRLRCVEVFLIVSDIDWSEIAEEQLDNLYLGPDPDLYNAVLMTCNLILEDPGISRGLSKTVQTEDGIRFRFPVDGHYPYKVFWSRTVDGARIEAIFPYK